MNEAPKMHNFGFSILPTKIDIAARANPWRLQAYPWC